MLAGDGHLVWVGLVEGRNSLALHLLCEHVHALEADVIFEADVIPGAGPVVVGTEEVLSVPKVFVDPEQLWSPWPLKSMPLAGMHCSRWWM